MQEHKRATETEDEKLVLPARPSSHEGAAEEGAGRKSDLSVAQIREWVEVYRKGNDSKFPSRESGQVLNADGSLAGESWSGLHTLFNRAQKGCPSRGLRGIGFKSLADFLDKTYPDEREVRVRIEKPDLSIEQIKGWVDVYRAANNRKFPSGGSGEVLNADGSPTGENWSGLDALFQTAQRGAPARGLRSSGFVSLPDFLDKTYPDERKVRVRIEKQDLSIEQIKRWVDVYREANDGKFPSQGSGEVLNADGSPTGETWVGLNSLFNGAQEGQPARGLKGLGFESLADFLSKTYPGERLRKQDLSIEQIEGWVDVHRAANDEKFPSAESGKVLNADGSPTGETWGGLDELFRTAQKGRPARGLQNSGFTSLSDFLDKSYPTERAGERRAPAARPKSDDINVLLGLLE